MVYIVHSLNYCTMRGSVEYNYTHATQALRISYGFATILEHKNYATLWLRYDTIHYLF